MKDTPWMEEEPRPQVLVVDEDPDERRRLRELAERCGCRVTDYAGGREALDGAAGDAPDIAIVNVHLSDMGGLELVRVMHWQSPALDVVMTTERATLQSAVEAINVGAFRYFRRPFASSELMETLRTLVMRHQVELEHQRSVDRLRFMRGLDEVILRSLDPEEIVRGCLARVAERLGAARAAVLLDGERDGTPRLTVAAARGVKAEQIPGALGSPQLSTFVRATEELRWLTREEAPRLVGESCVGALLLRIVSQRRTIGVVMLGFRPGQKIANHDVDLLRAVSVQLGLALGNARLYQEAQRAYRELRDAQRHLVRTEKFSAIGRLAAGLAHEIGTPLAIISGRAEVLLGKLDGQPGMTKGLETILRQIDRISTLIRNLLGFAREYPPSKERVLLADVVGEAMDLVRLGMERAGVDILCAGLDDLPPIHGDAHQLQQVFINLLMNAVDAISAREERAEEDLAPGRIRVEARVPQAGWVEISVSDNGVGIAEEHLDRVFEPFFTTKAVGMGTGLGLAVVDGIVGKHGGELLALRRDAGGAIFRVRLPAGLQDRRDRSVVLD